MIQLNFLQKLSVRSKLITAFVITLVPTMMLASVVFYAYLKHSYLDATEKELKNSAHALVGMIETAASVSIKNYLRAVAEKNLEIIAGYYDLYQAGRMDREEMLASARTLIGAQSIGQSGYIYCLDSQGQIVVHPKETLQGSRLIDFPFIQDQVSDKVGYLEYEWQNPDDEAPRPKGLYMVYFEPLDWIISVSAYRQEFRSLIHFSDINDSVADLRFGDAGYAFVTDIKGNLLIHPRSAQTGNIVEIIANGAEVFGTIAAQKGGKIRYTYNEPLDQVSHRKLAYFEYIDDYGWYVGTSYTEAEIFKPLKTLKALVAVFALLILSMPIAVAIWFSSYANSHFSRLMDAFAQGAGGFFKVRLATGAQDEFGRLSHYFNSFMEKLENYQQSLLQEIDKRRQMQNTVYESEQRLKTLVQNAPVLLWAVDRDGNLIFYEGDLPIRFDSCECMATGFPLKELWRQWPEVGPHIDRALAGRSGSWLIQEAELAMEIHYNPLLDINGEVNGAVGVAIDVSSRWQAERKLSEAEQERQKLVMAVEQSAEIIVITDTSGVIEYVNPAFEKISGYTKAEAMGRRPSLLKSGRHDQRFYRDLWQTISAGKVWSGRIVNCKKDGTLFHEEATISPLRNEDGTIVNYVASKRDVTQEVALQDQLQHSQRMKAIGTLAGGIAHDFNNILSGMMGYTEICLLEAPRESAIYKRLEKIMAAGLRAKDLISHIQTFSRQSTLDPIPMLPAPVIAEAVKLIEATFPAVRFQCRIQDVGAIRAVPTQIHQIVMNLCTNACHAMLPDGGDLSVTLSKTTMESAAARMALELSADTYVKLTVSDTGHGISEAIIDKIFDPYFTTKGKGEGSGLGLAVVHGIVKSMAGAIDVKSRPGAGTTFDVYLPLLSTTEEKPTAREDAIPLGNQESILLVDDEAYALDTTQALLESLNYGVTARSSTLDALKLFEAQPHRFDMVITDFTVPQLNGAEFAVAVQRIRPALPVIICTGFSDDQRLDPIKREASVRLINKPIIRSDLARRVSAMLHPTE